MWYFNPKPDSNTMDVYDHEGSVVAEDTPINFDRDGEPVGAWVGDYPDRVKDIARETMDGTKTSAYNQELIADMATDNIEEGTPH